MMKRILLFILVLLAFTSCGEDIIIASFRIETKGFVLDANARDSLTPSAHFSHRYAGGVVTFSNNQQSYSFNTGMVFFDEYVFELPVGEYLMECFIDTASYYGQSGGSFITSPQMVIITDSTEKIVLDVQTTCSLILVNDEENKLDEPPSIIKRYSYSEGYFQSFPMARDTATSLYFAYFAPDTRPDNPTAYIWFYQNRPGIEKGGISTLDFSLGKVYMFEIHEK